MEVVSWRREVRSRGREGERSESMMETEGVAEPSANQRRGVVRSRRAFQAIGNRSESDARYVCDVAD